LNKKILIAIIVIVAVSIAGTVALNVWLAHNNLLPPMGLVAEISTMGSGRYDGEKGLYCIDSTIENSGKKDATNFKFDVRLYNIENDEEIKRETVTIGTIPAESVKNVNFTISVPTGLLDVRGQWDTTWIP
jgi:hypothetical protein